MPLNNPYEILGLSREEASLENIENAYNDSVRTYHPFKIWLKEHRHANPEEIDYYLKILNAYYALTALHSKQKNPEETKAASPQSDPIAALDFSVQQYLNDIYTDDQNSCPGTWLGMLDSEYSEPSILYFYSKVKGQTKVIPDFFKDLGLGPIHLQISIDKTIVSFRYMVTGFDLQQLKKKAKAHEKAKRALLMQEIEAKSQAHKEASTAVSAGEADKNKAEEEIKIPEKTGHRSSPVKTTATIAQPASMTSLYKEAVNLNSFTKPLPYNSDFSQQVTIGDLHGNALKFIYFLLTHDILRLKNGENDYTLLAKIYNKYRLTGEEAYDGLEPFDIFPGNNSELYEDFNTFKAILENATINENCTATVNPDFVLRLLGDALCDRGANDLFILEIYKKLKRGKVPVETILSNHDMEFIDATENEGSDQLFVDYVSGIGLNADFSLKALQGLVLREYITEQEIFKLARENYKTTLKLLSYALSEDGKEITLYTHAPYGLETIRCLAEELEVPYRDGTAADLAETINQINKNFQNHYVQRNCVSALCPKELRDAAYPPEVNPVNVAIWSRITARWNKVLKRERPYEHNGYHISYVHGHDGAGVAKKNHVINLDNFLGKFDNEVGDYTVTLTKGKSAVFFRPSSQVDQDSIEEKNPELRQKKSLDQSSSSSPHSIHNFKQKPASALSLNNQDNSEEENKDAAPPSGPQGKHST